MQVSDCCRSGYSTESEWSVRENDYIPKHFCHNCNLDCEISDIEKSNDAIKNDQEKIPLDLLPPESLEEIGKVLHFGAKKYAAHNWRKGMNWSRLIAASLRHIFAFVRGENNDPETGLSHLAHAGCCILFLLSFQLTNNGSDDRFNNNKTEE